MISDNHSRKAHSNTFSKKCVGESLTELRWILIGWFFLFRFTGRFVFTFEFELEHFSLEKLYYRKIGLFSDSVFSFISGTKKRSSLFSKNQFWEEKISFCFALRLSSLNVFTAYAFKVDQNCLEGRKLNFSSSLNFGLERFLINIWPWHTKKCRNYSRKVTIWYLHSHSNC